MGIRALEQRIIECGETDYKLYQKFIYDSFTEMMAIMKVIKPISERILELILENDDLTLLYKYSHYYTFMICQSHSHYLEYADLFGATKCHKYLKLLGQIHAFNVKK